MNDTYFGKRVIVTVDRGNSYNEGYVVEEIEKFVKIKVEALDEVTISVWVPKDWIKAVLT